MERCCRRDVRAHFLPVRNTIVRPPLVNRTSRRKFPLHQRRLLCHSGRATANLPLKSDLSLQYYTRPESISLSQKRRRRSLARGRLTLFMGLFGVAFILLTFGYIAWEQRNRLIQRNEDDLRNAAFFLADHTARLLEVTDLTLKQAAALMQGQSWDQIETSKPLWQQLHAVQAALPFIDVFAPAHDLASLRALEPHLVL